MSPRALLATLIALLLAAVPSGAASQATCSDAPLALQVLGSGGPFAGSARASSGYVVWARGRSVLLIDAGGGTFLRFGEAGARLTDLEAVLISHLHPDHVTDLPGFLWLIDSVRDRGLPLVGPSSGGVFPDIDTFARRLFDGRTGAFPVLSGSVGGPGRGVVLQTHVVDVNRAERTTLRLGSDLVLHAIGVPHASAGVADAATPSVAYRVEVAGRSLVFGSDQNGSDERFVGFAAGADLLLMHFAVSEENDGLIHATPSVVGRIARDAAVGRLVLSHVIEAPPGVADPQRFSGHALETSLAALRSIYRGPAEVASDLQCIGVP